MNLLHILVYFPCTSPNILEIVTELLEKCPTAATSMDCDGRTPLHHLLEFNSRRDNLMSALLLKYSDDTIIHKAIKSKYPSWDVIKDIVYGNANLISAVDRQVSFLL